MHVPLDQRGGKRRLGDDPLAASAQNVDLGALLVGREVRLQIELGNAVVVGCDPRAGGGGRLTREVLASSVAGRVVKAREQDPACRVLLDATQPTDPRRALRHLLDLNEVPGQPFPEGARLAGALKHEGRGPLHGVIEDRGLHAADLPEHLHAAVVARDKGALGGRERHVELALRVLSVDQERPGDADRHLRRARKVLDVPGETRWVE